MDRVAVLSGSSLFDMLSNDELAAIASLASEVPVTAGQVLFEEGELGDSIYVVVQGEVEVTRRDSTGSPACIATLGPQQFFGEMSLIDKEYRSATVRARTACELLHFTSDNLTSFRKHHRDGFTLIVINIARMLSARLREANVRGAR
ncbi:MAG: cyclic nucleotide-binding domain-containing protein [Myxococcales bacterium]|nr:cyclic nucleotide-binding domain-containing protein [Myxococcales bacterium]MDP3505371.1 cyclic nucleotide-binding domain-containing protein [Myxococcales bacterium]